MNEKNNLSEELIKKEKDDLFEEEKIKILNDLERDDTFFGPTYRQQACIAVENYNRKFSSSTFGGRGSMAFTNFVTTLSPPGSDPVEPKFTRRL